VNLGDGITLTFTAGTADFAANDQFMVRATIGGYYSGNSDALKTVIGTGNVFTFNINGAELATSANGPAATVAVAGAGSGLTVEDTITLSRGGSASSWTLTGRENYPDMVITSQSSTTVTIDADNDGADDLTISLSGNWNSGNTLSFEVSPGSPPSVANVDAGGPGSVDLLTTLFALRDALASNDETAIAAQVEDLKVAQTQILQAQTKSGAKLNALEMASKNHDAVNLQITNMLADIENADLTKLITEFQMKQIAMQASYSMASQIGKLTILDYI
ncbi:MAG TPA: flagellin, partial [Smithellaceae bacterium]|nr:flagellin [Smithellaceae bacterium]